MAGSMVLIVSFKVHYEAVTTQITTDDIISDDFVYDAVVPIIER